MEKIDLREEIDESVNNNLSQNAVYDDFLIDELMVILKREIIKAFDEGLSIGDSRNYKGINYYKEKF
jgi:hypothetical protein